MPAFKDKTGQRFGRLVVIQRSENIGKDTNWVCQCDCGTIKTVSSGSLAQGTKSCGCLRREVSAKLMGGMNRSHGKTKTRLHAIWRNMRYRCNNPSAKPHPLYGGRGISVCKDWDDFEVFERWALANGYKDDLTLDREDNDGDYTPENCRWANWEVQNNNKSNTHHLTHNGKTLSVSQWSRELRLNLATVFSRVRSGLPVNEILRTGDQQ